MTLSPRQQAQLRIADTMDGDELAKIERVKAMRGRHVGSGRDANVEALYTKLIRNTQIEDEKLAAVVLMGESGSGKTHLVRTMEQLPEFQPYYVEGIDLKMLPYISIDAPPGAAPNFLIAEIVKKCGCPIVVPGNVPAMVTLAMKWFAKRRVMFVHIDEFQHALRNMTPKQIQDIQDAIKKLIQISAEWPVQMILSGTPEKLKGFRASGKELKTRTIPLELDALTFDDKETILKIVDGIVTHHAGLMPVGLDTEEFAHKLLKSANYQFGNIVENIRFACAEAIYDDDKEVGVGRFANVYATLVDTVGPDENMFLSANWNRLEIPDAIRDGQAYADYAKRKVKPRTFKVRR